MNNKVCFVLSSRESYDSFFGGAVARVVSSLRGNINSSNVFAKVKSTHHMYPGGVINPKKISLIVARLDMLLSNINKSLDGWVWCLYVYLYLKNQRLLIIENKEHYVLILRKMGFKGKIILHLHNDRSKAHSTFIENFVDKTDLIICCSKYIQNVYTSSVPKFFPKSRVVYNGISQSHAKYPNTKNINEIIFVGRIVPQKGLHILLDAIGRLKFEYKDIILRVIGSSHFGAEFGITSYEKKIKQIVEKNGIGDNVIFEGYVDHVSTLKLISKAKVLCLPSIGPEAFPLTLLESKLVKTFVIASEIGGNIESVENDGILFKPNDSKCLSSAIKAVFKMKPNEYEKMVALGHEQIKSKFNIENISTQLQRIIDQLANNESVTYN